MMKEAVLTSNAPQPIGPYSQAVLSKGVLYISGQLPLNPNTNKLAIGIEDQARQCLENLKHILIEKGLEMNSVLKTTIFVTDLSDFQTVNEIYAEYFSKPFPARSTIQVAELPMNAMIEIELMAEVKR
ncbi:Rid family detoxifying hydrolase [Peribacillus sp. Bi96]|uniref:RidA family protein n=2 Tax=unclassified Peribacillus TaxID=2675266 RepID=UPI001E5D8102|nr:Rid family detoxifying hydrolase [Peribacillus sp. Bi96]